MTRVAIPALIVLVAVAALVSAAGWNGGGEPEQVITLTERELSLPYGGGIADEDPALQLTINYHAPHEPLESRNWLPEARLREIGFSMHVPAGAPDAAHTYDHVPPRVAWMVLEYDGPAWRELARRRELQPERFRDHGPASRLVAVDAGPDVERLRLRYPSGHLIVRSVIGLSYWSPQVGGPLITGVLRELVPPRVAVPLPFRALLQPLRERAPGAMTEPRYEVDLAVGRLGVPYVRSVRAARSAP